MPKLIYVTSLPWTWDGMMWRLVYLGILVLILAATVLLLKEKT